MKKILPIFLTIISLFCLSARADEPIVIFEPDFSVFTDGSIESPVDFKYSFQVADKMSSIYDNRNTASAGGGLLIKDNGYITFKQFSELPSSSGCIIKVTAEIKMGDSYGGRFVVSKNGTGSVTLTLENDEWTTVTCYISDFGYTSSSKLKFAPLWSASGVFIRSLKVEYSADFIIPPKAYLPNDADDTSFTAQCSRVSGASKYEIDVFSLDDKDQPEYFVQDEEIKAISTYSNPSKKVTGLDPEKTYYYVARAINSNGVKSESSDVVEVIRCISEIDAPEATEATNVSKDGFTANWKATENAVRYQVNYYSSATLTEDSNISVFSEDFSGVNVGSFTSLDYDGQLNDFTNVKGWLYDMSKAFAKGYYVMWPTLDEGKVVTPSIDLSKNDGKFSVIVNAASGSYGTFTINDNTITVSLVKGDDINDLEVIETADAQKISSKDWIDYKFDFTKGDADSRICITFTVNDVSIDKLFINAIDVTQELAAGSVVEKQLGSVDVDNVTSAYIEVPMDGVKEFYYDVIAFGETVIGSGDSAYVGEIKSGSSNRVLVSKDLSSIDNVIDDTTTPKAWKVADGVLGINGSNVVVSDMQGRILYNATNNNDGTYTIELNTRGLLIVVVDNNPYKIIL